MIRLSYYQTAGRGPTGPSESESADFCNRAVAGKSELGDDGDDGDDGHAAEKIRKDKWDKWDYCNYCRQGKVILYLGRASVRSVRIRRASR